MLGVRLSLPFSMSNFRLFQFTQVLIYAIALLGLNMLTGYKPSPAVTYPSMGSVIAHEFGPRNNLPAYIGVPSADGGATIHLPSMTRPTGREAPQCGRPAADCGSSRRCSTRRRPPNRSRAQSVLSIQRTRRIPVSVGPSRARRRGRC